MGPKTNKIVVLDKKHWKRQNEGRTIFVVVRPFHKGVRKFMGLQTGNRLAELLKNEKDKKDASVWELKTTPPKQGLPKLFWCDHFIYINTGTGICFLNLEGDVCKSLPLMFVPIGPFSPIADCFSTGVDPLSDHSLFSPFNNSYLGFKACRQSCGQSTNLWTSWRNDTCRRFWGLKGTFRSFHPFSTCPILRLKANNQLKNITSPGWRSKRGRWWNSKRLGRRRWWTSGYQQLVIRAGKPRDPREVEWVRDTMYWPSWMDNG